MDVGKMEAGQGLSDASLRAERSWASSPGLKAAASPSKVQQQLSPALISPGHAQMLDIT